MHKEWKFMFKQCVFAKNKGKLRKILLSDQLLLLAIFAVVDVFKDKAYYYLYFLCPQVEFLYAIDKQNSIYINNIFKWFSYSVHFMIGILWHYRLFFLRCMFTHAQTEIFRQPRSIFVIRNEFSHLQAQQAKTTKYTCENSIKAVNK